MRHSAFEIETVARFERVFLAAQKNLKFAFEHVQEFLTNMRIGFTAAGSRRDPEQVRLHHRISPRKQFHSDARAGLKHLACLRPDYSRHLLRGVVEIENVVLIMAGQSPQSSN